MATIITRSGKGSPLTNTEVDNNFTNLNTAKYESGDNIVAGSVSIAIGNNHLKINRQGSDSNGLYWERAGIQDAAIRVQNNEHLTIDNNFGNPIKLRTGAVGAEAELFVVSTSQIVANESGYDTDFRVESDSNTHALFVDAGNNRVGVGTNTPSAPLAISAVPDADYGVINISGTTGNPTIVTLNRDGSQTGGFYIQRGTTADFKLVVDSNETTVLQYNGGNTGDDLQIVQGAGTGVLVATFASTGDIIFNDNGGDHNFRVESDTNPDMFGIDAGGNYAYIGSDVATSGLHIGSSVDNTYAASLPYAASTDDTLSIYNNPSVSADNYTSFLMQARGAQTAAFRQVLKASAPGGSGGGDGTLYWQFRDSADTGNTVTRLMFTSEGGLTTYPLATANVVFNEDGVDADFRVESDGNANMLFVDAGNNHVNVGTSTDYGGVFNVSGIKNFSSNIPQNQLSIVDTAAIGSGGGGGAVLFNGVYTSGGDTTSAAAIQGWKSNTTSGNFQFGIKLSSRTHGGPMDERLFMDEATTVFNETGANTDFRVESDTNTHALFVDAGNSTVNINSSVANGAFALKVAGTGASGARTGWFGGPDVNTATSTSAPVLAIENTNPTTGNMTVLGFQTSSSVSTGVIGFKNENLASGYGTFYLASRGATNGWANKLAVYDTEVTWNEEGLAAFDFRVESDTNTHMLFVDAGNNNIAINNSSAGATLDVNGNMKYRYLRPEAAASHSSSSDVWWQWGTIVFSGSETAKLTVQGTQSYSAGGNIAGETEIFLRGNNGLTTLNGYFRSQSMGNVPVFGVAWKNTGNNNEYIIYLRLSSFAAFDYTMQTSGEWTESISSTGSQTVPSGATQLSTIYHEWYGNNITYSQWNTETVFNESGVDRNFRVESDSNANALFVDAGTSRVGINVTSAPSGDLQVVSELVVGSATSGVVGSFNLYENGNNYFQMKGSTSVSNTIDTQWVGTSSIGNLNINETNVTINDLGEAGADFRVESDTNTHALFVDASSSYVGINRTPGVELDIKRSGTAYPLRIGSEGGAGRSMLFADVAGTPTKYNWLLGAQYNTDDGWELTPSTAAGGYTFTNRVLTAYAATGNLVVNENGIDSDFRVESDSKSNMFVVNAATNRVSINNTGDSAGVLSIHQTGYSSGEIGLNIVHGGSGNGINTLANFTNNSDQDIQFRLSEVGATTKAVYIGPSTATQMNLACSVGNYNRDFYIDTVSVVVNQDSRDMDFRVESNNSSSMLFVDAGDDRVFMAGQTDGNAALNPSVLHVGAYAGRNGIKVELNASANYVAFSGKGGNTDWYYGHMVNPSNSVVGSIVCNNTSTSYNTSSDYRLKENVVELTGATERLKQLKPSRFNFITDPDKTVDGFLAHEVQAVVPEAIHGVKDEVDAEGNPVHQGIDQSKLVPLLVATIKELEARITALENA